ARPAAAQSTWTGLGGDSNWTTAANWSGGVPASGPATAVVFAGTNRPNPVQNVANPFALNSLTFGSSAGAFSLAGAGLNFVSSGPTPPTVSQNSGSVQSVDVPVTLTGNLT